MELWITRERPSGLSLIHIFTALGLEGSGALVEQLTEEAVSALNGFPQPDFLIWLARELASRRK